MLTKIAVLFDHFGPYHIARLRADRTFVVGVELFGCSREYAWDPAERGGLEVLTLFPDPFPAPSTSTIRSAMHVALDRLQPQVVAVPGWSSPGALAALDWCLSQRVPAILMSESTAHDEVRSGWKEWMKSRLVRCCSAALCGGSAHAAYLRQLGMPADRIFLGYDAVDNGHFARIEGRGVAIGGDEVTRRECNPALPAPGEPSTFPPSDLLPAEGGPPQLSGLKSPPSSATPYFLASARFVAKKNLPSLLRAFARYRERSAATGAVPWNLVLLGDGPMRPELEALATELGFTTHTPSETTRRECNPALHGADTAGVGASGNTDDGGRTTLMFDKTQAGRLCSITHPECNPSLIRPASSGLKSPPSSLDGTVGQGAHLAHSNTSGSTSPTPIQNPVHPEKSCSSCPNFLILPGFKQYDELPAWYQGAGAFIHASTTEQWGLVVNEAMAAGLPILVSERCGCAPDLVREGVNGWTFDPSDLEAMAESMLKMATLPDPERAAMGHASMDIIADWGPQRFADGMGAAAACALKNGPHPPSLADRLLLRLLILR